MAPFEQPAISTDVWVVTIISVVYLKIWCFAGFLLARTRCTKKKKGGGVEHL